MFVENQAEACWVTIDEVSIYLKIHKDTIRLWIKNKDFPAHKIGKQWRFKFSEIDAWIKKGENTESH